MAQYVTCAACRAYFLLPDVTSGQEARCPVCQTLVQPTSAQSFPGGQGKSAQPNKTILAEPEAMIRYTCAKCKKALESPASFAGTKLNCPGCNQRLQIPQKPTPPIAPPVNKTILALGEGESPPTAAHASPPPVPQPPPFVSPNEVELIEESPVAAAAPLAAREGCLECGVDVSKRSRVQTCPDCGSVFCSAQCYREHRYHAHEKKRKKRRRDVECENCGSNARPYVTSGISESGWVTFAILLILFFPLCWIGLLMNETRVKCSDCGARLD